VTVQLSQPYERFKCILNFGGETPDRPAHSQLLYGLGYPCSTSKFWSHEIHHTDSYFHKKQYKVNTEKFSVVVNISASYSEVPG
jgi:hypothetical protein